jgi:hypothetical protein
VRWEAEASAGLQLFDDARAVLRDCSLRGELGLWSLGDSRLKLSGGRVTGERVGLRAAEGADVELSGVELSGGEQALTAEGWATVRARGCRLTGPVVERQHGWVRSAP